jgi:hypothetical protein
MVSTTFSSRRYPISDIVVGRFNFEPERMKQPVLPQYFKIPLDPREKTVHINTMRNHSSQSLSELRRQLSENFPTAHRQREEVETFPLPGLQAIPKSSLNELIVGKTTPGCALILAHLLEDDESPVPLALIDPADSFDPASFQARRPLLWLRSQNASKSLQAADLLLRDGNLPLILLDLTLTPEIELRQIPASSWYRLRNLAETSGSTLLAFTPAPLIAAAASRQTLTSTLTLANLHELRSQLYPFLHSQPLNPTNARLFS